MRRYDYFSFTIGKHYLPALINADETGLTDTESEDLASFLSQDCFAGLVGHWDCDTEDGTDIRRCEISGELSDCTVCRFVFFLGD